MLAQNSAAAETELVGRIASGDRDAFSVLYDLYSKPLYSFAVRILNDQKEAEDVLQEVFLQIWERGGAFDERVGKPFNWAVTMTRNKAIDRLRSRQRRVRLVEEATVSAEVNDFAAAREPEHAFGHDQAAQIRKAMQELPNEQRCPIELAFFGGLTHLEIATTLKEPLGTIKARIRRGMLKLRDALGAQV